MTRIRKQINELTTDDLRIWPVWEFASDEEGIAGQDETTIRPVAVVGKLDSASDMFIIPAKFTLADKSEMGGYLTTVQSGTARLCDIQPVILTSRGQVGLYWGMFAPTTEHIRVLYEHMGKSAGEVFPLDFESSIEMIGFPIRGRVEGFQILEDFETRSTRWVI